jgi:hypothetical protein
LIATFVVVHGGEWFVLTPEGFFDTSSPAAAPLLGISRGLDTYGVDQIWQSLYAPDLVREKLAGDPDGEVARSAAVISLDKVPETGKALKLRLPPPPRQDRGTKDVLMALPDELREGGGGELILLSVGQSARFRTGGVGCSSCCVLFSPW